MLKHCKRNERSSTIEVYTKKTDTQNSGKPIFTNQSCYVGFGNNLLWHLVININPQDSPICTQKSSWMIQKFESNLYATSHMLRSIAIFFFFLSSLCPFYWGFLSCNSRRCINVCLWCNPINWNSLLWCLYRFIIERHKRTTLYEHVYEICFFFTVVLL